MNTYVSNIDFIKSVHGNKKTKKNTKQADFMAILLENSKNLLRENSRKIPKTTDKKPDETEILSKQYFHLNIRSNNKKRNEKVKSIKSEQQDKIDNGSIQIGKKEKTSSEKTSANSPDILQKNLEILPVIRLKTEKSDKKQNVLSSTTEEDLKHIRNQNSIHQHTDIGLERITLNKKSLHSNNQLYKEKTPETVSDKNVKNRSAINFSAEKIKINENQEKSFSVDLQETSFEKTSYIEIEDRKNSKSNPQKVDSKKDIQLKDDSKHIHYTDFKTTLTDKKEFEKNKTEKVQNNTTKSANIQITEKVTPSLHLNVSFPASQRNNPLSTSLTCSTSCHPSPQSRGRFPEGDNYSLKQNFKNINSLSSPVLKQEHSQDLFVTSSPHLNVGLPASSWDNSHSTGVTCSTSCRQFAEQTSRQPIGRPPIGDNNNLKQNFKNIKLLSSHLLKDELSRSLSVNIVRDGYTDYLSTPDIKESIQKELTNREIKTINNPDLKQSAQAVFNNKTQTFQYKPNVYKTTDTDLAKSINNKKENKDTMDFTYSSKKRTNYKQSVNNAKITDNKKVDKQDVLSKADIHITGKERFEHEISGENILLTTKDQKDLKLQDQPKKQEVQLNRDITVHNNNDISNNNGNSSKQSLDKGYSYTDTNLSENLQEYENSSFNRQFNMHIKLDGLNINLSLNRNFLNMTLIFNNHTNLSLEQLRTEISDILEETGFAEYNLRLKTKDKKVYSESRALKENSYGRSEINVRV